MSENTLNVQSVYRLKKSARRVFSQYGIYSGYQALVKAYSVGA